MKPKKEKITEAERLRRRELRESQRLRKDICMCLEIAAEDHPDLEVAEILVRAVEGLPDFDAGHFVHATDEQLMAAIAAFNPEK